MISIEQLAGQVESPGVSNACFSPGGVFPPTSLPSRPAGWQVAGLQPRRTPADFSACHAPGVVDRGAMHGRCAVLDRTSTSVDRFGHAGQVVGARTQLAITWAVPGSELGPSTTIWRWSLLGQLAGSVARCQHGAGIASGGTGSLPEDEALEPAMPPTTSAARTTRRLRGAYDPASCSSRPYEHGQLVGPAGSVSSLPGPVTRGNFSGIARPAQRPVRRARGCPACSW